MFCLCHIPHTLSPQVHHTHNYCDIALILNHCHILFFTKAWSPSVLLKQDIYSPTNWVKMTTALFFTHAFTYCIFSSTQSLTIPDMHNYGHTVYCLLTPSWHPPHSVSYTHMHTPLIAAASPSELFSPWKSGFTSLLFMLQKNTDLSLYKEPRGSLHWPSPQDVWCQIRITKPCFCVPFWKHTCGIKRDVSV